jgi:D-glycero-D-manno-heptose 1,7-bisphosphate phosphatase
MQKAVFLDRDGVINRAIIKNGKPYPPTDVHALEVPAEVAPALAALKTAGFLLLGITNQPDVARGTTPRATVEAINSVLLDTLPITTILVCYHDDVDACECRKPRPGLLLQAAAQYQIDLSQSFMIGDRWRDVEAGKQAGCKSIWLDYGYAEKKPAQPPAFTAHSLTEAVTWILKNEVITNDSN